jgi:hypothetical protein
MAFLMPVDLNQSEVIKGSLHTLPLFHQVSKRVLGDGAHPEDH